MGIERVARLIRATLAIVLVAMSHASLRAQVPAVQTVDERVLREYSGVYQWQPDAFLYLQPWDELTGKKQLLAFDEAGDVRVLYPTDHDHFLAGPAAAVATSVESAIQFQRDRTGRIISLSGQRGGAALRVARRRFVPLYAATVRAWLARRIRAFHP